MIRMSGWQEHMSSWFPRTVLLEMLWWTWCQWFALERQGKIWVRDRWKVAKIYVNSWFLPLGFDMIWLITVFARLSRMADHLTTTLRLMLRASSHSLDCGIVWRMVCISWSHQWVLDFRCMLTVPFSKNKRVLSINVQEIWLCGMIAVACERLFMILYKLICGFCILMSYVS